MNYITKNDYKNLFEKLTGPLKGHFDEHGLHIGHTGAIYENNTIPVEGFLRILWGFVPYIAGGNSDNELLNTYLDGFRVGTDKNLPTYWGDCGDIDQLYVEMAPIAYALLFAKDNFWEKLSEETKDNLAKWLYQINEHFIPTNNWQMFTVLVNIALKKVDRKYSQKKIDDSLKTVEGTYLGNGWYTDGYTQRRDYYISFAIHFYCLIYAVSMEDEDPELSQKFKRRAEKFAHEFIYWFSEDGSALPYGRSLTYRFAQVSFWSACLIADVKPFDYGVIKGIISRHLNDWMNCPVCDNAGILTIGYKYPNLFMSEQYNAPGSPYWSFKAFGMLMLNDKHPFWNAEIQPLPELDEIKTLDKAQMIITRNKENVCAYPIGLQEDADMGKMDCKYSKFAYSTKFGFSVSRSHLNLAENAPDSMLAFVINGYVFVRNQVTECHVENGIVHSKWSPFEGICVETEIIPSKSGHMRHHKITSDYNCDAYDCGFAVCASNDNECECTCVNNRAKAENEFSSCEVYGKDAEGFIINAYPNTNLICNRTRIPSVKYKIKKGVSYIETNVIFE